MTKTRWYPGNVRPVHPGFYERMGGGTHPAAFFGGVWYWEDKDCWKCSYWQSLPWRGIVREEESHD